MRLLFFGSPDFAVPSLRALHAAGHRIAAVVTRPDRPSGRGRRPQPTAVKSAAFELGLPVRQPEDVNAVESVARLRALRAELGVVVAFGAILSEELLGVTGRGLVNLHASLLPAYRGAAPVNWALMRGERTTGVSVIRVVPRLDAGPVLARREVAIEPDETAGQLEERLARLGAGLLVDVLGRLDAGEEVPEEQQPAETPFFARKLSKADGKLNWGLPAEGVRNHVRGLTPWPGAYCEFQTAEGMRRVTLLKVETADGAPAADARPGEVVATDADGVLVQTGEGLLRITRIKPAGSRAMGAADFVNGYNVEPGDRFI